MLSGQGETNWETLLDQGTYRGADAVVTPMPTKKELSPAQQRVVDAVVAGRNVFFTGSAGTGKSFTMQHIIKVLKKMKKNVYITASTGIAATHIGGVTLHSFGGTGIKLDNLNHILVKVDKNPDARKRWQDCQVLVIDEISMLSGTFFTTLNQVAQVMRKDRRSFGGIQLVVTGDFFQLPPVKEKDFVFESPAWKECIDVSIVLETVFRQRDDAVFIELLQNARMGFVTDKQDQMLQRRVRHPLMQSNPTRLYTRRDGADAENKRHLDKLSGPLVCFNATLHVQRKTSYEDKQAGETLKRNCLAPEELQLKVGAQVILLKNLNPPHLVNGSRGRVVGFEEEEGFKYPVVEFTNGITLKVTRQVWECKNGTRLQASYKQIPLCLAWALTVHKGQGMTLDAAVLDIGECWDPGQAYVALSRCTSLEGVSLLSYNRAKIKADKKVIEFYASLGDAKAKELVNKSEDDTKNAFGKRQVGSIDNEDCAKKYVKVNGKFQQWANNWLGGGVKK